MLHVRLYSLIAFITQITTQLYKLHGSKHQQCIFSNRFFQQESSTYCIQTKIQFKMRFKGIINIIIGCCICSKYNNVDTFFYTEKIRANPFYRLGETCCHRALSYMFQSVSQSCVGQITHRGQKTSKKVKNSFHKTLPAAYFIH